MLDLLLTFELRLMDCWRTGDDGEHGVVTTGGFVAGALCAALETSPSSDTGRMVVAWYLKGKRREMADKLLIPRPFLGVSPPSPLSPVTRRLACVNASCPWSLGK